MQIFTIIAVCTKNIATLATSQSVDIVYNFYEAAAGLFLPSALIVSRDQHGIFLHIQQKATTATIGAFHLDLTPVRQRLFHLIDELQPKAIEEHFRQPRRKVRPLSELVADREVQPAVFRYVQSRLHEILDQSFRHDFPLCWDAERKALVKDFMVEKVKEPLEPLLFFKKTDDQVLYRLTFREGDHIWRISERTVAPIVNNPAWIFADYRIYRIQDLNGNLVKPFRQRDEVVIPTDKVTVYFKKFILKVIAKVDVEAEGFAVEQRTGLQYCRLVPQPHLFSQGWVLSVQMDYPGTSFGWQEVRQQRSLLHMEGDAIKIIQIKRDPAAEQTYLDILHAKGLATPEGSTYFELPGADVSLLDWLARQQTELREAGFVIEAPTVDAGTLYLHPATISLSSATDNDWLDLKGEVVIGEFRFPFLKLASCIRQNNPYYTLPNGEVFLIPAEWMNRYRDLFQFGRPTGETLRLAKSQFPIVEALGLTVAALEKNQEADEYLPTPELKATLRPYQLRGVRWLIQHYHHGLGACLADDMGLGKTLQTIAVLLFAKSRKTQPLPASPQQASMGQMNLFADDIATLRPLNALIVLPASLVYNWAEEITRFGPSLSIYAHTGPKRHKDARLLARFDVILTTYQTALRDVELLGKLTYEYIVLDESQQIKNRESKVFRAINTLDAHHKISLSGTPIENSLSDLWAQMHFINPDLLGGPTFFKREFITPIERRGDDLKKDKLRALVQPYLLRRTKTEVAPDLPELHKQTVYTEMTKEQKSIYEREKSAARNHLLENYTGGDGQYRMLVIQTLTKLRQLANHPRLVSAEYEKGSGKFSEVLEQWEVIRKGGHKVLFFSSFVKYLELFRAEFDAHQYPYAWLTGQVNTAQRQREIRKFQEDPAVQAFFISIKSGGTGLNLTAADYVFILDPWWNPTTEDQAIARAHRIGQDKKVFAHKFITRGSIEEKIISLQDRKSQLAEDIIGEHSKLAFDRQELAFLLS